MNRDAYKEKISSWAKDLKDQMKDDPSLESHLEKLFQSLDDPRATEQEWYEQAEAVYQAISRSDASQAGRQPFRTVPIGGHRLPSLPYSYSALEPYISREIRFDIYLIVFNIKLFFHNLYNYYFKYFILKTL